jgi:hypothetical protein
MISTMGVSVRQVHVQMCNSSLAGCNAIDDNILGKPQSDSAVQHSDGVQQK